MKKITARHIMAPCRATLRPDDTLKTVAKYLRDTQLDCLPVIDANGSLLGIMTKAKVYDALTASNGPDTPITDLYSKDIHTMPESMPYREVAEVVRNCKVGSAVVLDDRNEMAGIISKSDWIMAMFRKEGYLVNQLQAINNSMHNGMIAVDEERIVRMINLAAEQSLGVDASRVMRQPIQSLFPNMDLDLVMEKGKVIVGAKISRGDRNFLCNITPLIDDGDSTYKEIIGAIIVFQDTTDLERVASTLEFVTNLNDTLQSVLDIAYDGIMIVDGDANVSMVSRSMEKFLKIPSQDMIGKPITQFIENSGLPRVIKTGQPESNKLHTIKGKSYVVSRMPVINNGKVIGAVGKIVFKDLASLKELAQKLEKASSEAEYYKKLATSGRSNEICFDHIVTADSRMIAVKEESKTASRSKLNILITGESGTGKELFVRSIHAESGRKGRLVSVNCAAIPENLLESEFFGYAGGAFSGAQPKGKTGKFSAADGGTLFLDEIGDMTPALQSKLLRVLQEGCFEPVGSNRTVHVDVRIIAATNHDILKMVKDGSFRSDLFFRLNTVHLHIPPLIERQKDIYLLFNHFLNKYNGIFGTRVEGCSGKVREILENHTWPGNVRELENVVERAANFAKGNTVQIQDLPLYLRDKSLVQENHSNDSQPSVASMQKQKLDLEKRIILDTIEKTGGNKAKAARMLRISRSWLYQKLKD